MAKPNSNLEIVQQPGLLTEIEDEQYRLKNKNRGCALGKILSELSSEDYEVLKDALNKYTGIAISSALGKRGYSVSEQIIRRHRRGLCSCPESTR